MNPLYVTAIGGLTMLTGLTFQVLVGLRKIHFKGALHLKIHKWTGYALLVGAIGHGTFAAGSLIFGWF